MTKAPGMHVWRSVCLRKEGGGAWVSYQLLKLQNYPVGLRSLSNVCCFPPLPGISKELPKRMQRTTLCDIYRHYSSVTSYLTTFPISLHFQRSWPIYLCCGEINLDPWIGGKGKKTGENSIELHTISGTGIQISWGIRECIPIAKRLCAGKDNRDF